MPLVERYSTWIEHQAAVAGLKPKQQATADQTAGGKGLRAGIRQLIRIGPDRSGQPNCREGSKACEAGLRHTVRSFHETRGRRDERLERLGGPQRDRARHHRPDAGGGAHFVNAAAAVDA